MGNRGGGWGIAVGAADRPQSSGSGGGGGNRQIRLAEAAAEVISQRVRLTQRATLSADVRQRVAAAHIILKGGEE